MRLVLNLDAPWSAVVPAFGEAFAFTRDDLPARLHTTPLYDPFAQPEAADGVAVEILGERAARSALDWPVRVIERVVTASGAPPRRELEVRYAFFELGGSAVVTGPVDAIAGHRDELLAAMFGGRPEWSGHIACLADLLPRPQ